MDMHIHMSNCTSNGFRILANSYLGVSGNQHRLSGEIESMIDSMEVTPAEVAEELMKSDDVDVALEGLVNFLKRKKVEISEKKTLEESNKSEVDQEALVVLEEPAGQAQKAKKMKVENQNNNSHDNVRRIVRNITRRVSSRGRSFRRFPYNL